MKICVLAFLLFGLVWADDVIESSIIESNLQDSKDSNNLQNLDSKQNTKSANLDSKKLENIESNIPYKKHTITITTDNDAYFPLTDKDRYYTAGHSLTYTHAERKDSFLRFLGFAWLIEKSAFIESSKQSRVDSKDYNNITNKLENIESNMQDSNNLQNLDSKQTAKNSQDSIDSKNITESKNNNLNPNNQQNLDSKNITESNLQRFYLNPHAKPISRYAISIAQEIYTPHEKFTPNTPRDDLPYAGYLYLSLSAQNRIGNFLEQTSLNIGVVGPYALGREAQDFIHESMNFPKYPGWSYQIQNEPVLNLYYKAAYKLPLLPRYIEAIPRASLALGNAHTHFDVALNLRAGYGLQGDFGFSYARNSGFSTTSIDNGFRIYAQLDFLARLVMRNIFIQGNTIDGLQTSLNLNPLIYELNLGAMCAWKGFSLGFNYTIRSEEFTTQRGKDNFATFRLELSF